jgi:hypothetical protein
MRSVRTGEACEWELSPLSHMQVPGTWKCSVQTLCVGGAHTLLHIVFHEGLDGGGPFSLFSKILLYFTFTIAFSGHFHYSVKFCSILRLR